MTDSATTALREEDLVSAAQEGDRQAYGELVPRYGLLVHALCSGAAGAAHAGELAHEAFVEAWLKLPTLREPDRFAPWLRRLTLNLCRMWHRQRRRHEAWLQDLDVDELSDAQDAPDSDLLFTGLSKLSQDHRLTLALHYWEGLTYEQIATFLDVPVGTVMSRMHRARNQLRERMEQMLSDDPPTTQDHFGQAVDAEIEVLLQMWAQESADPTPEIERQAHHRLSRGRYHSPAGQRLSVLVREAPDTMRVVLATMKEALREHAALLLRRAGGKAIRVAVACAFDADPVLRANARASLAHALERNPGQAHNENSRRLPLRQSAAFVLDALIQSPAPDDEKGTLLLDLLPGCEDEATMVLLAAAMRCYGDHTFPLLLNRWRTSRVPAYEDAAAATRVAILCRFGDRFLSVLKDELAEEDSPILRRTLEATASMAGLVDIFTLIGNNEPSDLERRITGHFSRSDLDRRLIEELGARLTQRIEHDDDGVADLAIRGLGGWGTLVHAPCLHAGLNSPRPTTRSATIVALRALGDRSCTEALMELCHDPDHGVRRLALQTLGHFGAPEARDLLIKLIEEPAVRAFAIAALGGVDDEASRDVLRDLMTSPDKKMARMASNALFGGTQTARPDTETRRERLARVRGEEAKPLLDVCVVGAIRHLPEDRPYAEKEITRLIGEVCTDYSTTRRELVMGGAGGPGLMIRRDGVYELTDSGRAVWRVEQFLKGSAVR